MPWYLKPSTWKRLPNGDDDCLVYSDRASSVFGAILVVLAVSGFVGTMYGMIRYWPDQQLSLGGGLLLALLILAIGLSFLLHHRVLINKSEGRIVCAWHWLLWHGKRTHDLRGYDSIMYVFNEVPRLPSEDIRRFNVILKGSNGTALTLFEQQSEEDASGLTEEIAGFLGLQVEKSVDENIKT
jgi:hypothetical protein